MTMMTTKKQGERRLSPGRYRLLVTTHVIVAVGWLGVVFAKLVLGLAAITAGATDVAAALYLSTSVVNVAFPPLAIATIVTGVLLSLGTKWGLLRHYWVATKLVLTVAVIATAIRFSDQLVRQAIGGVGPAALDGATLVIALSVTHLLMLVVATILSTYKPWGQTRVGRRVGASPAQSLTPDLPTTR
jgi:hypothetical protein